MKEISIMLIQQLAGLLVLCSLAAFLLAVRSKSALFSLFFYGQTKEKKGKGKGKWKVK